MRVGLLFPHDPRARPPGIDLVRLLALGRGLRALGMQADVLAPVARAGRWRGLPLLPLAALREARAYDLVKTCYHQAVFLAEGYAGPLVARLVRVVDERHPARDARRRAELLRAQEIVAMRAQAVALNNPENLQRWRGLYGEGPPALLAPTGCPARLPALGPDPFGLARPAVVYAGSLASPRQAAMLGRVALALGGRARVHFAGRNKSGLYGHRVALPPLVIDHGEQPPRRMWDFLRWADAGLVLAVGPQAFDNDSSKALHYLRAGLPLVCEAPVLQGPLAEGLGLGRIRAHSDAAGLAEALAGLLAAPPGPGRRRAAQAHMARQHGWERTVRAYAGLFARLAGAGPRQ